MCALQGWAAAGRVTLEPGALLLRGGAARLRGSKRAPCSGLLHFYVALINGTVQRSGQPLLEPRFAQRGTFAPGTDRPDLHRQIRDSVILLPSRSRAHMQLCSTPARTHNAWRRPAQQRSEHPPRLLYQRWNNRSHCSQVARWVEHIALRPVATDPAAGQCRPPQDERPPRALLEVGPRLWAGARSRPSPTRTTTIRLQR